MSPFTPLATAAAGGGAGGGPKKDIKLFIILITFMCPYEQGPTTTSGPFAGWWKKGVGKILSRVVGSGICCFILK